ncbi:MAG: murein hydrolase activator EnvC family protein [Candidatus Aquicultorales bacterium]
MQTRYKRLMAGLLTGTVFLSTGSVALADPALDALNAKNQETRNKLDANVAQQNQLAAEIIQLDSKFVEANNQLQAITAQLNQAHAQKAQVEQRIAAIKTELAKTLAELAQAKKKLKRQQAILNNRAEGIYKRGESSVMDIVLNSKDFADFINRFSFLQMILGQDTKLVQKVLDAKAIVERKEKEQEAQKREAEAQQAALAKEVERIYGLQQQQAAQVRAVNEQKAAKDALMAQLENDKRILAVEQASEAAESAALTARINGLTSRGGARTASPVAAATSGWVIPAGSMADVTSEFGPRSSPTAGASSNHMGMDFGLPEGTPIVAANSGTVIEAGYGGGYGNLTVIDHGNGLTSAYAHQSSIAVSVGQTVQAGQLIGYIGSTGVSTGPHLHFEIRVDGEPQNPRGWLGG